MLPIRIITRMMNASEISPSTKARIAAQISRMVMGLLNWDIKSNNVDEAAVFFKPFKPYVVRRLAASAVSSPLSDTDQCSNARALLKVQYASGARTGLFAINVKG